MDLGTGGGAEFKMTPEVTAYIADNLDLFTCDIGLIHSHHSMGAFISGQDAKMLQQEGNDTNCFLSLVVDTKGTYVAAITRKMQKKTEIVTKSLGTSYQFFGEGEIRTDENPMSESTRVVDEKTIEYFMMDVQIEKVDNPLSFLDTRFEEIEKKKKVAIPKPPICFPTTTQSATKLTEDQSFYDWIHGKETIHEPTLFSSEEMEEMKKEDILDMVDDTYITQSVTKMLLCTLNFTVPQNYNLKGWIITHMDNLYNKLFPNESIFRSWREFAVEYFIFNPEVVTTIDEVDDEEEFSGIIAKAMIEELQKYENLSPHIQAYINTLTSYIY